MIPTGEQRLFDVIVDLSIEAAKISFQRDDKNNDFEPEKIAWELFLKYQKSYDFLFEKAKPLLNELKNQK